MLTSVMVRFETGALSGVCFREWYAGEAEVRNPGHARHGCGSSSASGSGWVDVGVSSRKAIEPKVSAS
jgi:hypothetical protein